MDNKDFLRGKLEGLTKAIEYIDGGSELMRQDIEAEMDDIKAELNLKSMAH